MKTRIKFRLEKWERAVVFQVLEMDKEFRCASRIMKTDFKTDNFSVLSYENLAICNQRWHEIYLWGYDKDRDFNIDSVYFDDNTIRDEYYDKVIKSLKYWAKNYPWSDKEEVETVKADDNIFEF